MHAFSHLIEKNERVLKIVMGKLYSCEHVVTKNAMDYTCRVENQNNKKKCGLNYKQK